MASGTTYDIVHPCAYRFQDYVDLGAMQPWDTSLIPNFSQLNPALEKAGQIDGKQYFIVEDWGFIAPLYRADKVDPQEDSWSLLFDDRYAGKISWINTLEMLVIAAYLNGVANPWDMTDEELDAQKQFLISKKPLVQGLLGSVLRAVPGLQARRGLDRVRVAGRVRLRQGRGAGRRVHEPEGGPHHVVVRAGAVRRLPELLPRARRTRIRGRVRRRRSSSWGPTTTGTPTRTSTSTAISADIVKALSLDDLSILEPPNSNVESYIPRRQDYANAWDEVKAS